MEEQAMAYIRKIDDLGGIIRAIDTGYSQHEIADAAYGYQLMDDRGRKVVVGVNKYVPCRREARRVPQAREADGARADRERAGAEGIARYGKGGRRLKQLAEAVPERHNVMPFSVDRGQGLRLPGRSVRRVRQVFGLYRETIIF